MVLLRDLSMTDGPAEHERMVLVPLDGEDLDIPGIDREADRVALSVEKGPTNPVPLERGMPTDGPTAKCYPSEEQYERWKVNADDAGMSVSEFIASMVEAGHKTFTVNTEPDLSNLELRRERNKLRQRLEQARDEITKLEKSKAQDLDRYIHMDYESIEQKYRDDIYRFGL